MDQFDMVKQFNEDLDSILNGGPRTSGNKVQTQHDDLLDLAVALAETKPTPDSGKQQVLRRQLINRCREHYTVRNKKEAVMKNFFRKRRIAPVACSFALAALFGFYLILPGTFTAMAKDLGTILKLGPYVTLIEDNTAPGPSSVSPLTPEQEAELDKNGYVQFTAEDGGLVTISTWGKPSVDTVEYTSLADAQTGVSYKLLAPAYLPEGYSFKNAECYKGSKDYITLNFQGPGKDIILMQRVMKEQTKYEAGGKFEPIMINGNSGAWVDSGLIWNKGGVNYILFAKGFSKDEIKKIAESI